MARILVLGAGGMAGHMAALYLAERGHDVLSTTRKPRTDAIILDAESESELSAVMEKHRPDIVLNCIGVLIKESETNPIRAIRLNSLLPRILESLALRLSFKLIHVSTDCVFSGNQGHYKEDDIRDGQGTYARTKALGEINSARELTIRTSYIGPEIKTSGTGLFNWFMNQRGNVSGYTHALWSGVTTLELAKAVNYLVGHPLTGILNLTNGEPISKYDLLCLIHATWGKPDVAILPDDKVTNDKSLVCTRKDFVYHVPTYAAMMEEMRAFMDTHRTQYKQYE
jgi:dTDP-4-dehydrorhamnose reductase